MLYPELYIPNEISNIYTSKPKIWELPEKPVPPKNPIEPIKQVESYREIIYLVIFILLCVIFLSYIFVMWSRMSDGELKTYLIFTSFFLLVFILRIDYIVKRKKERELKFKADKNQFINAQKEFIKNEAEYKENLLQYEKEVEKRSTSNEYSQSEIGIFKYRNNQLSNFIHSHFLPIEELESSEKIRKGASESFFESYLRNCGLFYVYTNIMIEKKHQLFYYPDFILKERNSNLLLNIEIDEPYSCINGKPIHYQSNYDSYDNERNVFFLNQGFIVIRFAEKQIFENPTYCVEYIVTVVNNIHKFKSEKTVSNDFVLPKWSKDQANEWAYKRYRHTYVPKQYHKLIDADLWNEQDEFERQRVVNNYTRFFCSSNNDLPF